MLYFDTSFLIPLVLPEPTSKQVEELLLQGDIELTTSRWSLVEFSSMLARRVRMRELDEAAARQASAKFRSIADESFEVLLPTVEDFDLSIAYLEHYETGLRGGDALHLAIAANHAAASIYTLDRKLLDAGKRLGLPVKSGTRGG